MASTAPLQGPTSQRSVIAWPVPRAGTIGRRALLREAAVAGTGAMLLWTGGCTAQPQKAKPSAQAAVTLNVEPWDTFGHMPRLLSAYQQHNPKVTLLPWTSGTEPANVPYAVVASFSHAPAAQARVEYAALDAPLRLLNFNGRALLPGLLQSFSAGGQTYGLPLAPIPVGVIWRRDAFTAAGLEPPAPDWTLDDFTHACAAIQRVVNSGRLTDLAAVLPVASGAHAIFQPHSANVWGQWYGELRDWIVAAAFAQGFGAGSSDRWRPPPVLRRRPVFQKRDRVPLRMYRRDDVDAVRSGGSVRASVTDRPAGGRNGSPR